MCDLQSVSSMRCSKEKVNFIMTNYELTQTSTQERENETVNLLDKIKKEDDTRSASSSSSKNPVKKTQLSPIMIQSDPIVKIENGFKVPQALK